MIPLALYLAPAILTALWIVRREPRSLIAPDPSDTADDIAFAALWRGLFWPLVLTMAGLAWASRRRGLERRARRELDWESRKVPAGHLERIAAEFERYVQRWGRGS